MNTRLTTAIAAAVISLTAAAQTEAPDTIAAFDNPTSVTITDRPDGTQTVTVTWLNPKGEKTAFQYTVSGPEGQSSFIDNRRGWNLNRLLSSRTPGRHQKVTTGWMQDIYAGALIPTGDHGIVTGGWEIGVNNIVCGIWQPGRNSAWLSLGAGLGWEIQTVGHGYTLYKDNGALVMAPHQEGHYDYRTNINRFHFTVPLSAGIPLSGSFCLKITGELHLNSYVTASSSWKMPDNVKASYSFKGLHQKIVTADITGAIGWRDGIGVYVTYSPMNPFKKGYGPEYKTIAIGGYINF